MATGKTGHASFVDHLDFTIAAGKNTAHFDTNGGHYRIVPAAR